MRNHRYPGVPCLLIVDWVQLDILQDQVSDISTTVIMFFVIWNMLTDMLDTVLEQQMNILNILYNYIIHIYI